LEPNRYYFYHYAFAVFVYSFQYGEYADIVGERKILMYGFGIAALATLSLFFITEHSIFIWAFLLFSTRIGASAVESMSDVYFFNISTPQMMNLWVYIAVPPRWRT